MEMKPENCCPHCGSIDQGYHYTSIEKFTVSGMWQIGHDENAEFDTVVKETIPVCSGCGKRVKL